MALAACSPCGGEIASRPSAEGRVVARLEFLRDDLPRALALARERRVPLFVDAWAPWCHTCLSMKATVFSDPRLAPHADRFVWLELDTDGPAGAAFLERFPMSYWPTLFVIDPATEKAVLRWAGSATVEQLEALLADGERVLGGPGEGPDALLARADRLLGEDDARGAIEVLEEALTSAPAGWPRRTRAVETLLQQLGYEHRDPVGCARRALAELPGLPRGVSRANVAALGLYCALGGPVPETVGPLEAAASDALGPPRIEMPADDRSVLFEGLVAARKAAGDAAGARTLAARWLAELEAAAAAAPTPEVRAVFVSHRLLAAMECGRTERAIAPLERSEREWPDDYNPPARLAVALASLGRLDEALAASDRALAKVAGPRRVRLLADRGDILLARGERDAAGVAFAGARALALETPDAQRQRTQLERAEKRLRELEGP